MKKVILAILGLTSILTFSCKKDNTQKDIAVSGISISKESISLLIGGKDTLKAIIQPSDATNNNVVWTSGNPSIATVNSNGVVTGIAIGKDTITISTFDGSKKSICMVSVVPIPIIATCISIPLTKTITCGVVDTFKVVFTPSNTTDKTVIWKSSDTTVVKINSNGVAMGMNIGFATITATTVVGNKTAICNMSVVATPIEPTSVSLSLNSLLLSVGNKSSLTATVNPTNATNTTVIWSSSNTAVATVSPTGLVSAVGAGTATITVTTSAGNKTATCAVSVLHSNEIPIDSLGNIRTDLVPTNNFRINYQKTLANYLNYNKTSVNSDRNFDTIVKFRIHYFMPNNGDTIFDEYCLAFQPNVRYTKMSLIPDDQWKLSGFMTPNKFGNFNLTYTCVRDDRTFTVVNNVLTISQAAVNTAISYTAICIDKDENYVKFLVNGCVLKFEFIRKSFFTYTDYKGWIDNTRAEKYIYPSCLTTIDSSAKTFNATSM